MFSHLSLSNSKYWVIQSARASLRVQARAQRPRWAYIYKALEGLYTHRQYSVIRAVHRVSQSVEL